MVESDYFELPAGAGEKINRFVERDDGWWILETIDEKWKFTHDDRGFCSSFEPPGGPVTVPGSVFTTARGRLLVVASIVVKGQELRIILMPREQA
jgi:hypothetical protein